MLYTNVFFLDKEKKHKTAHIKLKFFCIPEMQNIVSLLQFVFLDGELSSKVTHSMDKTVFALSKQEK